MQETLSQRILYANFKNNKSKIWVELQAEKMAISSIYSIIFSMHFG